MAAVILYDAAVETAAKVALRHVSAANRPKNYARESLPDVLSALAKEKGETGEVAEARRLHDLRNNVQHDGLTPGDDDVQRSEVRARGFLEWAAQTFLGTDIWRLSRASLIADQGIREQIEQAEAFGRDGIFDLGADRLAIAFELARDRFRAGALSNPLLRIRGTDVGRVAAAIASAPHKVRGTLTSGQIKGLFERMIRRIEALESHVEALALGADAADYEWFSRLFPEVHRDWDGTLSTMPTSRVPTRDEFNRAVDFVTRTALRWERFPSPPPETEGLDLGKPERD